MRAMFGWAGLGASVAVGAPAPPHDPTLTDLLNAFVNDPGFAGWKLLATFILALMATVRVALPPILEWRRARREAASLKTSDGPVLYSDLYARASETILDQHAEIVNLRTARDALRERTKLLAELLAERGGSLPPGQEPPERTLHEIVTGEPEPDARAWDAADDAE